MKLRKHYPKCKARIGDVVMMKDMSYKVPGIDAGAIGEVVTLCGSLCCCLRLGLRRYVCVCLEEIESLGVNVARSNTP
jgi:hypothetical protein